MLYNHHAVMYKPHALTVITLPITVMVKLINSLIISSYYTQYTRLCLYINSILCNIIHIIRHSLGISRYNCYGGTWGGERDGICSYGYRNVTAHNTQGLKKHLYINELIAHSTLDSKTYLYNNNLGIDIGAEIRNRLLIERLRKWTI